MQLVLSDVVNDQLANNQVKALEIIQAGDTFGIFSVALLATGFPDIAAAGVPLWTAPPNAPNAAGQESAFPIGGATCISCATPYYVFAADTVGATNVAALGYGVSQASKDCVAGLASSIERYGGDVGVELAYSNDTLALGLPNGIAPEVTAMKDVGVDFITTCLDQNAVKTIQQELERQGMGDVRVQLPNASGDPTLLADGGDLFEGDLVGQLTRPFAAVAEGTGMADFLEWIEQSDVPDLNLSWALNGWINADTAYQGILAAGPQFDRARVIAATNAIEDYTADGLVPPIDWGRQHEPPAEDDWLAHGPDPICITFVQVQGGEFVLVGEPDAPFLCWDPASLAPTSSRPPWTSTDRPEP